LKENRRRSNGGGGSRSDPHVSSSEVDAKNGLRCGFWGRAGDRPPPPSAGQSSKNPHSAQAGPHLQPPRSNMWADPGLRAAEGIFSFGTSVYIRAAAIPGKFSQDAFRGRSGFRPHVRGWNCSTQRGFRRKPQPRRERRRAVARPPVREARAAVPGMVSSRWTAFGPRARFEGQQGRRRVRVDRRGNGTIWLKAACSRLLGRHTSPRRGSADCGDSRTPRYPGVPEKN